MTEQKFKIRFYSSESCIFLILTKLWKTFVLTNKLTYNIAHTCSENSWKSPNDVPMLSLHVISSDQRYSLAINSMDISPELTRLCRRSASSWYAASCCFHCFTLAVDSNRAAVSLALFPLRVASSASQCLLIAELK